MKMMPPDVISHENQLQHLSEPSIFILDVFWTATTPDRFSYHTGNISFALLDSGTAMLFRKITFCSFIRLHHTLACVHAASVNSSVKFKFDQQCFKSD